MKFTKQFKDFFENEKTAGLLLIFCTLFSMIISNSSLASNYHHFWLFSIAGKPIEYWINDGLMTFFFLLIGLELEREIYKGELSNFKDALLPIFAAIGGMIIPAGIYLLFNFNTPTQSGTAIPMATDIAFALGILSLLGNKVPLSLKVFLTAFAVIDDLGAILVIAIFYTQKLYFLNLGIALSIFVFLYVLGKYFKVKNLFPYLIGGFFMWYFMLQSGVHATITGVLLAFAIPFGEDGKKSTSYNLQHFLHKPVTFLILPIFALANTAIATQFDFETIFSKNYSLGIAFGLILGKCVGIFTFSYLAVKLKICKLPIDLNWKSIFGVSFLGGIGFTMSIFITLLAFDNVAIINTAKIVILISSLIAGFLGCLVLNLALTKKKKK